MPVKACDNSKTLKDALSEAGEKLVVIDFHATWCGPCVRIAPAVSKMSESMTDVVFLKVDVDLNSDAAEEYNIEAMPTFKLVKGGSVVASIQGADEAAIEAAINQYK